MLSAFVVLVLVVAAAAALSSMQRAVAPEAATVITRMREVARLETLEVAVYKKVSFEPEPEPAASLAGEVLAWAKHEVAPRRGRAIVFGTAHVGLDLSKLDEGSVHIDGTHITVTLPRPVVRVELQPEQTEVIASNLDSAQTALMLEKGRAALEQDVRADRALQARARESSERALVALLITLGFEQVSLSPPLTRR